MISTTKLAEFRSLFNEFVGAYLDSADGETHLAGYGSSSAAARRNLEALAATQTRGQGFVEAVLNTLLPYSNSPANRDAGRWIHVAPTYTTDARIKHENAGWTDPQDWPAVAEAIYDFVSTCVSDPERLDEACQTFSSLPISKGFQSGALSPILHALRPDSYLLINSKSRTVINWLVEAQYSQNLSEYPAVNAAEKSIIAELREDIVAATDKDIDPIDLFDMFCHWLVAVKDYNFGTVSYWKIAPGEGAWQWDECHENGFIAIGWDDLGNIGDMDRATFERHRDTLIEQQSGWTANAVNQVWQFAHEIKEGDRVVANRGTTEVVGIGTVVGDYFFVPGVRHGHRLPVEWDDLTWRSVKKPGWKRTLVKLSRKDFTTILATPPTKKVLAAPFSQIFPTHEQAEWAFGLLKEVLTNLGVTSADDPRFAVTLRHHARVLRLNYGQWAILQFYGPTYKRFPVGVALLKEDVAKLQLPDDYDKWNPFTTSDGTEVVVYEVPLDWLKTIDLSSALQSSCKAIAQHFANWGASNVRRHNVREIAEATFSAEKLRKLLAEGFGVVTVPGEYFKEQSFELLAGLHTDPTKAFYDAHKDEFKKLVEEPFQQLLMRVAAELPASVTSVMETEKRLFSRITKNDYGQGGAWDFYWGAFYPKGQKRTDSPQLSMWMNRDLLEFGFYIGEYGTEDRERFIQNCKRYRTVLLKVLESSLSDSSLIFAEHHQITVTDGIGVSAPGLTLSEWLADPAQADCDVSSVLPRDTVLDMNEDELVAKILDVHKRVFPLVLLALEEDPLPAIREYLGYEEPKPDKNPQLPLSNIAASTGFALPDLEKWVRAVKRKNHAIFYGSPGTGKTFIAREIAKHLVGGGDGFIELVQFHPAYAYEDFILGLRPVRADDGGLDYVLMPGRFVTFCRQAAKREGVCVLIIDEINRANLSRVFGELMYLLEYREESVPLAGGQRFLIPKNVRIIGTMNTADRSIALVDHALRRRFAFLRLEPQYEVLKHYHSDTGFPIERLIALLEKLNKTIGNPDYAVGIAFFLRKDLAEQFEDIWCMEILPYLEEYFFDQLDRIKLYEWPEVKSTVMG